VTVRVYVDGRGVDAPDGATALDAVRAADPAAADAVAAGDRAIVDSRALPLDPTTPMVAGTILRLVRGRGA
jgi:hypothetical protein